MPGHVKQAPWRCYLFVRICIGGAQLARCPSPWRPMQRTRVQAGLFHREPSPAVTTAPTTPPVTQTLWDFSSHTGRVTEAVLGSLSLLFVDSKMDYVARLKLLWGPQCGWSKELGCAAKMLLLSLLPYLSLCSLFTRHENVLKHCSENKGGSREGGNWQRVCLNLSHGCQWPFESSWWHFSVAQLPGSGPQTTSTAVVSLALLGNWLNTGGLKPKVYFTFHAWVCVFVLDAYNECAARICVLNRFSTTFLNFKVLFQWCRWRVFIIYGSFSFFRVEKFFVLYCKCFFKNFLLNGSSLYHCENLFLVLPHWKTDFKQTI